MKREWMLAAAVLLGTCKTAAAEAPDVPVKAFMGICMSARGNADVARAAALDGRFSVAAPEQKARLMREGGDGDVYVARDLALVVERSRPMCTVFGLSADAEATHGALKAMLPPSSTAFTTETEEVADTPGASSVAYHISMNGRKVADWVFTRYKRDAVFNVAITLQMIR